MLNELPPMKSVYNQYHARDNGGIFTGVHSALRRKLEKYDGKIASSWPVIADNQSVKMIGRCGPHGCDIGKKCMVENGIFLWI